MKLTPLQKLGKNIRKIRLSRKMSLQELADKTGLRKATIIDIEYGRSNITFSTLAVIADCLECKLEVNLDPDKNSP